MSVSELKHFVLFLISLNTYEVCLSTLDPLTRVFINKICHRLANRVEETLCKDFHRQIYCCVLINAWILNVIKRSEPCWCWKLMHFFFFYWRPRVSESEWERARECGEQMKEELSYFTLALCAASAAIRLRGEAC